MTMNPPPRSWVWPSIVTARSCIACSRAAWVFGGVRLISSASSSWVKIGPRVSANWLVWKLNRLVPRTSPGIRSGVNWMRPNFSERAAAKVRASRVLATPGTPSSRTCPSDSRLTSNNSMAASCPITTLRSCCFSCPPTERIVSKSMQHLPFPAIEVACNMQQAAMVRAPGRRRDLGVATQLSRRAPDMARLADPLQPLIECRPGELCRRVDAADHIGEGHGKIAPEDFGRVAAELQQPGGIPDEGRLARLERRLDGNRRSKPTGRRPQEHGHRRQGIDGDDDDRELEQGAPHAGIAAEAVDDFVDNDRAAGGQQLLHHADADHGVAAAFQSLVGNEIGIGQHPQPPIALPGLAEQHAQIAVDERGQPVRRHQLRLGKTRLAAETVVVPVDLALHGP